MHQLDGMDSGRKRVLCETVDLLHRPWLCQSDNVPRLRCLWSQITTPDALGAVTVRALMPGGIEPLDPLVAAGASTQCAEGDAGISFSSRLFPLCPKQVGPGAMVRCGIQSCLITIRFRVSEVHVGIVVLETLI